MRLRKEYKAAVNSMDDLGYKVARVCSNIWEFRKVLRGEPVQTEGTLTYRKVYLSMKGDISVGELKQKVTEMLKAGNIRGVSVHVGISKMGHKVVTLTNTLVGDRVTYYTVDMKGDTASVRKIIVDLPVGKSMVYGVNMYPTKEEAESAANSVIAMLSGAEVIVNLPVEN